MVGFIKNDANLAHLAVDERRHRDGAGKRSLAFVALQFDHVTSDFGFLARSHGTQNARCFLDDGDTVAWKCDLSNQRWVCWPGAGPGERKDQLIACLSVGSAHLRQCGTEVRADAVANSPLENCGLKGRACFIRGT